MADRPRFDLDADPDNADWTKGTWDLPVHDVESLRAYLAAQRRTVAAFKRLPIYRMNVKKLPWLRDL